MRFICAICCCVFALMSLEAIGQDLTQNIRGHVQDKDTRAPLVGATLALFRDSSFWGGSSTDIDGNFRIEGVPIGRYTAVVTYLGYKQAVVPNLMVSTGKEQILNIELQENLETLKEFQVEATGNRGETLNKMATVSARQFSVEETERYAGSRGDPARMASNFAGVQGADDSRNDIVVRGNSPLSVLWKVDGINIPNPNHFAVAGSQGGPVSILNNKVLANSDFFTGAFPAEYGNSTAAVFDIRMRNGNNEKHEFTGQFGFLGTELTAEGPISREKKSSYLVNYRYSTLGLFSALNVPIGTNAVPQYQDGAFKVMFPNKKGSVSFFGLGGQSSIDINISKQHPSEREIYGETDRDQEFGTSMGVVGMNWFRRLGDKTYSRLALAHSIEKQDSHHKLIYNASDSLGVPFADANGFYLVDSLVDILQYSFQIQKTSASYVVNHKLNAQHVFRAGVDVDFYQLAFYDSLYNAGTTYDWNVRWNYTGNAVLVQPFVQWQWRASERLVVNTGLHSMYFDASNSLSPIEPRIGLRYSITEKSWFNLGTGLHSQLQPLYTYYYELADATRNTNRYNRTMDFTKSIHYVAGYDRLIGKFLRMKAEVYYQDLYNVPVTIRSSSFSLVNQGSGFVRFFPDSLNNTGSAENYGVEFTLEKFFSNQYYFMVTASVFDSKYTGSDGVTRNTDFNGNYVGNLLFAKEFKVGKKSVFNVGAKITYAGNKRYGPVDTAATRLFREIIFVDSTRNSLQFDPYFRVDVKLNYRINAKKMAHEIGLDLVNVTNQKNVLKISYVNDPDDPTGVPIREEYQLGFLPLFYYRLDF